MPIFKNSLLSLLKLLTAGNSNDAFTQENTGNRKPLAAETGVYYISNIILHIEAYQFKSNDYSNDMKSLFEAGKYRYHFKRYVLFSDVATSSRQTDYRMVVNSECVNYILAIFLPNNYGTISSTQIQSDLPVEVSVQFKNIDNI